MRSLMIVSLVLLALFVSVSALTAGTDTSSVQAPLSIGSGS